MKRTISQLFLVLSISLMALSANAEQPVTVYAAASLTNALSEVSAQFEKQTSTKILHSFAASSALAKQIENAAPADVFISADKKWMDYLQDKKLIDVASRSDLLANRLVLIAPKGQGFAVNLDKAFNFAGAFSGKLCTGDIDSVPAGIYAKQALNYFSWWDGIKSRIVGTQDVRGTLAFVERGECAAGIVYETDAKISEKVDIVAVFPEDSHLPIVYPVAFVSSGKNLNKAYLDYLKSAPAMAIFKQYGFSPIAQ